MRRGRFVLMWMGSRWIGGNEDGDMMGWEEVGLDCVFLTFWCLGFSLKGCLGYI